MLSRATLNVAEQVSWRKSRENEN